MEKNQISELIVTIRSEYEHKINKLKQDMETTISSLENLFDIKEELTPKKETSRSTQLLQKIKKANITPTIPVPKRMKSALNKMHGEFHRYELFEVTNSDDTGVNSPIGTLAIAFSNLVKSGDIIEVRKASGTNKGLYRRGDEQVTPAVGQVGVV